MNAFLTWVVQRRLMVVCLALMLAGYGWYAYQNTAIEAYPDVTNVRVGVITLAPGMAPEEVERQVTLPLEKVLNGTPGMQALRSESYFGLSMVTLVFNDRAKSFDARVRVNERIQAAELPDGITPTMSPDNTPLGKVLYFQLTSDRHNLAELRSEQDWTVARVLKQVEGVADVVSMGGFVKEYHIEADLERLFAHNLTLDQVVDAVAASNQNVGGGMLRRGEQSFIIRGIGLLRTTRDIETIVLASHEGTPVRIKDVARVVQSYTPRQGSIGMNGENDVVQGIVLLMRGENPSKVLEQVHKKIEALNQRILPEGMEIVTGYDRSDLIEHTINTVHHNLLFGALLIISVLWLSMRSLRASLIVAIIIPLSLLVAFIGLYLLGMPANLISMGAIDFGIIVDGAVVLTEAIIHRARVAQPRTRKEMIKIIIESAGSVAKPTLFAMAIVIAALIPVFSLESIEGRIFRPLALTYTFALLGALVLAMVLVPALCALFLRPKDVQGKEPKLLLWLYERYTKTIKAIMSVKRKRWLTLGGACIATALVLVSGVRLGTEFLPELDEGDAYVLVEMPAAISLEAGQDLLREMRLRLKSFPEVIDVTSEQGRPEDGTDNETVNVAKILARLHPRDQWVSGRSKSDLIAEMRESLSDLPGVQFNFAQPIRDSVEESTSGARGHVVLKMFGEDLNFSRDRLLKAKKLFEGIEGVVDLDLYRDSPSPQLMIRFDREALARYGISMQVADTTVETALAGKVVTTAWEGERSVPVRVRLPFQERMDESRIKNIVVPAPDGKFVPLHAIADIHFEVGNASIFREGNVRFMALKFNVEDRDIGSVVREAQQLFSSLGDLPDGYYPEWAGQWENQQRAAARLEMVVPLSLLVVFALLFMALGSARSAFIILLTAPFVMSGGVLALHIVSIPLSISAAIGFIALLGQVALAGLLVISAVEHNRQSGMSFDEAIIHGCKERMRAVIMVAVLGMLGLLPMVLSTAVGSETQRPFASVVVGGMALLPLVSLFLLPLIYRALSNKKLLRRLGEDGQLGEGVDHAS